ncbi:Response regulator receiver protein [Verrucomicrobia bacterium]|nr:Response regulator receiver protein [Verrucomicrobiota bacterium]
MPTEIIRRKQFLFVDDNAEFLSSLRELFTAMSGGAWEIFTAGSHAQALGLLQERRMDVVVVDIGMPVMSGLEFLRLLGRTHPGQQVVMLTGLATQENRKACLESGAALFLEKPTSSSGFEAVFAALDALAGAQPQAGFRGMLRRVGLQEVLQLECLGRKSSVLEIFTDKVRGRIFICDGSIVHADSGALQGEVALYGLLALRGGDFNFRSFAEPPRRTIQGHWESLLMEAARLSDEGADFFKRGAGEAVAEEAPGQSAPSDRASEATPATAVSSVRIEELILCTGGGEVLYDWQCQSLEGRLRLLEQVEQQAAELSTLAAVGRFDRLEILSPEARVVCQVQPHMRLFMRSATIKGAPL